MKTTNGEMKAISCDHISINNDMVEIDNLVCVPMNATTKIITSIGTFDGVQSQSNPFVIFPFVAMTTSEAAKEIPSLMEDMAGALEAQKKAQDAEKEEE